MGTETPKLSEMLLVLADEVLDRMQWGCAGTHQHPDQPKPHHHHDDRCIDGPGIVREAARIIAVVDDGGPEVEQILAEIYAIENNPHRWQEGKTSPLWQKVCDWYHAYAIDKARIAKVRALRDEFVSRAEAQRKTGGYECDTHAEAYEEIAEMLEAALTIGAEDEGDNHAD